MCALYIQSSVGIKNSEICATKTRTSKIKKKIIFDPSPRRRPPNGPYRLSAPVSPGHRVPGHENSSPFRSTNRMEKLLRLLKYKLLDRPEDSLVCSENSGPTSASSRSSRAHRK